MATNKNGKRVLLSERNTALAQEVVKNLRDKHCRVNLTDFVNSALHLFLEKHFSQHQGKIEKIFFDRKKYLKELLKAESNEILDDSLKELVQKIKPKKIKKVEDEPVTNE